MPANYVAIQSLVFAGADKYHAYFGSGNTTLTREQEKPTPRTPKRNKNNHNLTIDITRRPLPLTIINVVQNGQHELYRNPDVAVASHPVGKTPVTPKTAPVALTPLADNLRLQQLESAMRMEPPPAYRTTYNHWSGTTL